MGPIIYSFNDDGRAGFTKIEHFVQGKIPLWHLLNAKSQFMSGGLCQ